MALQQYSEALEDLEVVCRSEPEEFEVCQCVASGFVLLQEGGWGTCCGLQGLLETKRGAKC